MDTVEVNTMVFDDKEFFEVDILDNGTDRYDFYAEIDNPENVKIFKLINVNGEDYLEDVNANELVEALKLFNIKYN